MQMLTPTLQFFSDSSNKIVPSQILDVLNCQDTYGLNNYNAIDMLARANVPYPGVVYYCLNGEGHIYPALPSGSNLSASSPLNEGNEIYKSQYAVLGIFSSILFLLGVATLLRTFCKDKPHNRNTDEHDGLLNTTPTVELKYYGSGENSINRFAAFQPQNDNGNKGPIYSSGPNNI